MNLERILVAAAESITRRDLRDILLTQEFAVVEARNCEEALEEIEAGRMDLALLDITLSAIDCFETCRKICSSSHVPVILLLGPDHADLGGARALESGAEDCLTRPFGSDQLIARIRAAIRTEQTEVQKAIFETPCLKIDFACRQLVIDDRHVHLTPKELELLRLLVVNQGKPVSNAKLLKALWGTTDLNHIGHLRVFVNQLRKKIEPRSKGPRQSHIQTDNFVGYHFDPNPHPPANSGRSKRSHLSSH